MSVPDLAAVMAANLSALRSEGAALAEVSREHWDAPVAACPGWDVADLVAHTGSVHRWVSAVLSGQRVRRSELPPAPAGVDARLDWYAEGLSTLVGDLEASDPGGEVWTFGASGDGRVAWWGRRMAQETAVHRWDAASCSGSPAGFAPSLAVQGIEEYLVDFLPEHLGSVPSMRAGTLHVHATDDPGEWVVDLTTGAVERVHAKATTALRGPASDLLLWLWNRQPADGHLEVFGDRAVVDGWPAFRI